MKKVVNRYKAKILITNFKTGVIAVSRILDYFGREKGKNI